jgi:hypothetical protein
MKIASRKKENPSRVNPSPNTFPKSWIHTGHSSPSSKDKMVPVTTPTANSASMMRDQRRASVRYSWSPVRRYRHSANRTSTGNAMPKHTSGICTASDSACICRASNR